MKLVVSIVAAVVVAFILSGVGLSVVVGSHTSDIEAGRERDDRQDERSDRMETRALETHREIKDELTEILGVLMEMSQEGRKK